MPAFNGTGPRRGRTSRIHDIILKVETYDTNAAFEKCYPGFAQGKVVGGELDGKLVRVAIRSTPGNSRTPRIADFANESARSFTPAGGLVSFRGLQDHGDAWQASWANKFANPSAELRVGMPIQISPALDSSGQPRRFQSNGATLYKAHVLHSPDAQTVNSVSELYDSVSKKFSEGRAAFISLVVPFGPSGVKRRTQTLWRGWQNGEVMPVDEAVLRAFSEPNHTIFEETYQRGGRIDVIPLEQLVVGPVTAESIDKGLKSQISLRSYATGGLGGRMETALRQSKRQASAAVEKAFLAGLHPNAKTAFAENGWRGVWASDIKRFYEGLGVELPTVPRSGFAVSTAVVQRFGEAKDKEARVFLTRSRTHGPAVPREAVATPSDRHAVARHYDEFRKAVSRAADIILRGPEKTNPFPETIFPEGNSKVPKHDLSEPGNSSERTVDTVFGEISDPSDASPDSSMSIE